MPQSEDKLALDALNERILYLKEFIQLAEISLAADKCKLEQLIDRKKSMENYLNSDNN